MKKLQTIKDQKKKEKVSTYKTIKPSENIKLTDED